MKLHQCIRCGQELTDRLDAERGYDEGCRGILNQAALQVAEDFTPDQIRKAVRALQSGACVWMHDGMYRFTSSDGKSVYWTTEHTCTCPASKECYHMATIRIRNLSPVR